MRRYANTSLLSLAILAALSAPVLAQEAGAQVKVDGVIDPAEWQGARHVTDFRMVQPFTQAATRHPTARMTTRRSARHLPTPRACLR